MKPKSPTYEVVEVYGALTGVPGRPENHEVFKVRPKMLVQPGDRVRREDGDSWIVKVVAGHTERRTMIRVDGPYQLYVGDKLTVIPRRM